MERAKLYSDLLQAKRRELLTELDYQQKGLLTSAVRSAPPLRHNALALFLFFSSFFFFFHLLDSVCLTAIV